MVETFFLRRARVGRFLIGLGMGWGPGIVVGVVLGFATSRWYFGALGFAVTCALTTIVMGSIASTRQRNAEQGTKDVPKTR